MKKIFIVLLLHNTFCNESSQNLQRYMLANYYQFGNDIKNAHYWYSQITPNAHDQNWVYVGYIPFLAAQNDFKTIASLIPTLDEPFKNNQEIQFIFANALEQVGKKNEAHTRLASLNEKNKGNQELAFKVVQMYIERSEPENALKVIDNLLNNSPRRPNNFIFYFVKSQILVQLNKKTEALACIKQCIQMYPRFDKSWLLYAVLQEQEGKLEEAIKGYSSYLETTTDAKAAIEQHLLGLSLRQKMHRQIAPAQEDHLARAQQLFDTEQFMPALTAINHHLKAQSLDAHAGLLKIQILVALKDIDKAASTLQEWIIADKKNDLWIETLHLLTYVGLSYKKAFDILEATAHKKKSSTPLALYQADLALRDNNQLQALDILRKAYPTIQEPLLKVKVATQIGIIYYEQDRWKQALQILEDAHKLAISYAPLENLLAYIYAAKEKKYVKAEEFINKALAHDSDNPHFLDTKAFIAYKQKKYADALTLFQKVAHHSPTDYTILCHLGKCYHKTGDHDRALQSIRAALTVAKNDKDKKEAQKLIERLSK